jgi:hypothetical protein
MKGYDMSGNPTVIKLASVEITGNVVPLEWFNHIKRPNGKPYTDAIFLLSDIVYWYRPIEVRDELTGKLLGLRKKFKADKLQRDYNSFAEQYGYTKNQVRDALGHLEKVGLIDLDFRHITVNGKKLGNVLFIGLNSDALMRITTLSDLKLIGCEEISQDPPNFKADTNTETTTETTTDIKGASLDWKLGHGQKITQAEVDQAKSIEEAPKMFEKAFGFGRLPWDSNRTWEKFRKFVTDIYLQDRTAFGQFTIWRNNEGKYKGWTNKLIRTNPAVFMDTAWLEFTNRNTPAPQYTPPSVTPDEAARLRADMAEHARRVGAR